MGPLTNLRTPIVAAVSGYSLGGGCELAMMCDLIFAAESAKFGQPEINLGIIPGMGMSQRLTHVIGKAKAMDISSPADTWKPQRPNGQAPCPGWFLMVRL